MQIEDKEGTCIIHSALGGHVECIVWMLNNGSSLLEKNQKGITCKTILTQKKSFSNIKFAKDNKVLKKINVLFEEASNK